MEPTDNPGQSVEKNRPEISPNETQGLLHTEKFPKKTRAEAEKIVEYLIAQEQKVDEIVANGTAFSDAIELAKSRINNETTTNQPIEPATPIFDPTTDIEALVHSHKLLIQGMIPGEDDIKGKPLDKAKTVIKRIINPMKFDTKRRERYLRSIAEYNAQLGRISVEINGAPSRYRSQPVEYTSDPENVDEINEFTNRALERERQTSDIEAAAARQINQLAQVREIGGHLPQRLLYNDREGKVTESERNLANQLDGSIAKITDSSPTVMKFRKTTTDTLEEIRNRRTQSNTTAIDVVLRDIFQKITADKYSVIPALISQEASDCIKRTLNRIATGEKDITYDEENLKLLMEIAARENERLGSSKKVLTHGGSNEGMLNILTSGKILSHRSQIEQYGSFTFSTGGDDSPFVRRVEFFADGLQITDTTSEKTWKYTWPEWDEKPNKPATLSKPPFQEFDQVLFQEEGFYHGGDKGISIVLPEREVFGQYQFTNNNDGIHIFDPEYDSDVGESQIDVYHRFPPGKKGAEIDLSKSHYVISVSKASREAFDTWLRNLPPDSPILKGFDTPEKWIEERVVYVDDLARDPLNVARGKLFSLQKIPTYSGQVVPTGNSGDTATTTKSIRTYLYQQK
jgi:hypothetical protein